MYRDPILSQHCFHAFADELAKQASLPHVNLGLKKRDVGMMALGAGALYGGNRIVKDIKDGEALRKQQAEAPAY